MLKFIGDKQRENTVWFTSSVICVFSHLAATARRFLALAAPGSTDRDLAASSSLLDAMEMFLRLPMTWIWSSLLCAGKEKEKHRWLLRLIQSSVEYYQKNLSRGKVFSRFNVPLPPISSYLTQQASLSLTKARVSCYINSNPTIFAN